jgi:hypothetical protein
MTGGNVAAEAARLQVLAGASGFMNEEISTLAACTSALFLPCTPCLPAPYIVAVRGCNRGTA